MDPLEQNMAWFCYCCGHFGFRKLRQLSWETNKLKITLRMPGSEDARKKKTADNMFTLVKHRIQTVLFEEGDCEVAGFVQWP